MGHRGNVCRDLHVCADIQLRPGTRKGPVALQGHVTPWQ